MKRVLAIIGVLIGLFLAVSIIAATPLVGEVVTLHTHGSGDAWETTPLWIVDLDNAPYLRAGTPAVSGWVERMRANPQVRLERGGEVLDVRLVEEGQRLAEVHAAMAEKYGWADDFVALMSGDRNQSLALRVEVVDEMSRHQ